MTRYPCLFTNRIKQKTKLFKDGFIDVAQERNGYKYLLLDENLSIIVSMKSPEKPLLNGDDFLVGGFLVQIFSGKKNQDDENETPIEKPQFMSSRTLLKKTNKVRPDKSDAAIMIEKNDSPKITQYYPIKTNSKSENKNASLRQNPRKFDEIIAFFNYSCDVSQDNDVSVIQNNLNDVCK